MSTKRIEIIPVQTDIFHLGDDLYEFVKRHASPFIRDGDVLAITSKIVSIAENRIVSHNEIQKKDLVRKEADHFIAESSYCFALTIKHGIIIPSAGIDESNAENDYYILYPEQPYVSAEKIYRHIKEEFKLKKLGIIITDSHTQPLRRGVIGIGLAHFGFKAVKNLIGKEDIFKRKLKFTTVNVLDALSVAAVFSMGEANERCPLAIVRGAGVEYSEAIDPMEIRIEPKDDIYYPLLKPYF